MVAVFVRPFLESYYEQHMVWVETFTPYVPRMDDQKNKLYLFIL